MRLSVGALAVILATGSGAWADDCSKVYHARISDINSSLSRRIRDAEGSRRAQEHGWDRKGESPTDKLIRSYKKDADEEKARATEALAECRKEARNQVQREYEHSSARADRERAAKNAVNDAYWAAQKAESDAFSAKRATERDAAQQKAAADNDAFLAKFKARQDADQPRERPASADHDALIAKAKTDADADARRKDRELVQAAEKQVDREKKLDERLFQIADAIEYSLTHDSTDTGTYAVEQITTAVLDAAGLNSAKALEKKTEQEYYAKRVGEVIANQSVVPEDRERAAQQKQQQAAREEKERRETRDKFGGLTDILEFGKSQPSPAALPDRDGWDHYLEPGSDARSSPHKKTTTCDELLNE
jgi:hypothetical protein